LKFYIPITLNPYIGFGVEQKVLGIKRSSNSFFNATLFIDAKANKCLTKYFYYILPSFGVRLHFL